MYAVSIATSMITRAWAGPYMWPLDVYGLCTCISHIGAAGVSTISKTYTDYVQEKMSFH